jgi:hypothetical protein
MEALDAVLALAPGAWMAQAADGSLSIARRDRWIKSVMSAASGPCRIVLRKGRYFDWQREPSFRPLDDVEITRLEAVDAEDGVDKGGHFSVPEGWAYRRDPNSYELGCGTGLPDPDRLSKLTLVLTATYLAEIEHVRLEPRERDQEQTTAGGTFVYHCRARPDDPPAFRILTGRELPRIINMTATDTAGHVLDLKPRRQDSWNHRATVPVRIPSDVATVEFEMVLRTERRTHTFEFKDVARQW